MTTQNIQLSDLGILSGDSNPACWRGTISRQKRIDAGEISESEIEASLHELANYFVPVAPGAAKRCIDGSSAREPRRALGPQIQGGTADEAYAMHLAGKLHADALLADLPELDGIRQTAFRAGDHTDDHADETKTGCGAIDGQLRKLALYSDVETAAIIANTVATLMGLIGAQPGAETFAALQSAAAALAQKPTYFPAPNEILAALRTLNPDAIELLIRPHAEVSLTVNFVSGTTFDRDMYNTRSGSKIQNFNLDAWNIVEEYGDDAYALLADAVATAMDLTDGSLRLFAVLPREA